MNLKFDFDDILVVPEITSSVRSRNEINLFDHNGKLPLFTAPMDTVIDSRNINYFENENINVIIPRTEQYDFQQTSISRWKAISLDEFECRYLATKIELDTAEYVVIDIANGHMEKLINDLKLAKDLYGLNNKLFIIAGNIGHPRSAIKFEGLCYGIRVGIGHGSPCLTTEQTAIGYPMASLVSETYFELHSTNYRSSKLKIIADGGFRSYSDIIKALALGADYVILGGIFNKALESAGDTYIQNAKHAGWVEPGPKIDQYDPKYVDMLKAGTNFYKLYRGMSTKEVQRLFGNKQIKTSEGITKLNKVEYTLNSWADNFKHYLRSAMSYTDSKTLIDFIGKVEIINITDNAYRRFHK